MVTNQCIYANKSKITVKKLNDLTTLNISDGFTSLSLVIEEDQIYSADEQFRILNNEKTYTELQDDILFLQEKLEQLEERYDNLLTINEKLRKKEVFLNYE